MFLPPDQRQSGPSPEEPRKPRRELTKREEAVLIWLIGFVVLLLVLAPIGGSTLWQGLWYLLRH